MLNEVETEIKFVVKVNGVTMSIPFSSRTLAEQHIQTLPVEQRAVAEVSTVTADGRTLLLG